MHAKALIAAAAAISTVAAAPADMRRAFIQAKRETGFGPAPLKLVEHSNATAGTDDAADTEYSTNWAGMISYAASGESFSSAVGTFVVPQCTDPNDGSTGPWYNAYWVGIDGTTDSAGLLQAGVICEIDTDGTESYVPWVEFFPTGLIELSGFPVNQGDTFTVTIQVDSPTTGTIILADGTTGQSTTTSLSAPSATNTLTGQSAEWILEDFSSGGGLVPFASFSPCVWSGTTATDTAGNTVDGATGDYILLQNSAGTTITSVSTDGSDGNTITYTG